MTIPPRTTAARPPWPATALPDAITYVLLGAAALIIYDGGTGTPGLLQAGAECACDMHGLPASLAPAIYRRAALCLARASGYQPLDTADPVIDRALDELPGYPPERQARLLTPAPHARTQRGDSHDTPRQPPRQPRPGGPRSTNAGRPGQHHDPRRRQPVRPRHQPPAGHRPAPRRRASHRRPRRQVPGMTPTALLARLTSRGYIPVSHGPTAYPENWLDLDGPAGSIRVVTHPDDGERAEVFGLGPRPARLTLFDIRLSGSAPQNVTVAMLNAAEAWLAGRLRP